MTTPASGTAGALKRYDFNEILIDQKVIFCYTLAIILTLHYMKNDNEYLTQEKFDEFTKELALLKGTRRKEVAESLEYAKSLGDLSENAEYHEARDNQATIEDRIAKLESLLKNAQIVSEKSHVGDVVSVGSVVTVEKEGKKAIYNIVGSEEADVVGNKISIKSPFGQAIFGKKKGEKFSFQAPAGEISYLIVDIK
ncbi:MAG: transcription elongation factor GreA [Candidatus Paceibacterota bacterium]